MNAMPILYDQTLKSAFILGKDLPQPTKDKLCDVRSQKLRFEKDGGIEGAGLLKEKIKGAPGAYGAINQGHTKGYQAKSYQLLVNVAKEDIDDAKAMGSVTKDAGDIGGHLRRSGFHFEESLAADLINQGFTNNTYTTGDGAAIFSNSHVYSNGQSWDNLETGAFSWTVLKNLALSIKGRTGPFGQNLNLGNGKFYLFFAPGIDDTVYETLNSKGKPGTANNDTNWFAGGLEIEAIRCPYLTGTQIVLRDATMPSELQYRVREKLAVQDPVEDKIARAFTYAVNARLAVGATYALGMAGSAGS